MQERAIHISSVNRQKIGRSRPEDFIIKFDPPLKLDTTMRHELAVDRVSMTYSWHNVNAGYNNNTIKYSPDNGTNWNTITFVDGMYSYDDLDDYITQSIIQMMKINHLLEKESIYILCFHHIELSLS